MASSKDTMEAEEVPMGAVGVAAGADQKDAINKDSNMEITEDPTRVKETFAIKNTVNIAEKTASKQKGLRMERIPVTPGFFSLPLNLFQVEVYDHLYARIDSCHRKLNSRVMPMRVALLNMLGMLYYSVRQIGNSLRAFEDALSIDAESVNSLQNISFIYDLLSRHKDASAARTMVQKILKTGTHLPSPAAARCLAEQAYALTFSVLDNDTDRLKLSSDYYKAASSVGKHVPQDEMAHWYICHGVTLHKIYDILFREHADNRERDSVYFESLEYFLVAQQLTAEQGPKHLYAQSWRFIGTLLSKSSSDKKKLVILQERYKLSAQQMIPENCFEIAKDWDPDNPESFTRYAKAMTRNRKDKGATGKAIKLLDGFIDKTKKSKSSRETRTIRLPLTDLWFPLVSRGRIYLRSYKKERNEWKLVKARQDFEEALKIQRNAESLADLGEVCHLIAMHEKQQGNGKRKKQKDEKQRQYKENMNNALTYFLDATLSLEGEKIPLIDIRYGQCLADYGEHRAAVERFKRALEKGGEIWYFDSVLDSFLKLYSDNPDIIAAELAYWIHHGTEQSLQRLCKQNRDVMDQVLKQLALQKNTEMLKRFIPIYSGDLKIDELIVETEEVISETGLEDMSEVLELSKISLHSPPVHKYPSMTSSTPHKGVCVVNQPTSEDSGFGSFGTSLPYAGSHVAEVDDSGIVPKPDVSIVSKFPGEDHDAETNTPAGHPTLADDNDTEAANVTSAPLSGLLTCGSGLKEKQSRVTELPHIVQKEETVDTLPSGIETGAIAMDVRDEENNALSSTQDTEMDLTPSSTVHLPKKDAMNKIGKSSTSTQTMETYPTLSTADASSKLSSTPPKECNPVSTESSLAQAIQHNDSRYIPDPVDQAWNHHDKKYDFFISFHKNDAYWVYHVLLPQCETTFNFKCCVPDRDYLLGKNILDDFHDTLENSVGTIFVVTPSFTESKFCKNELHAVMRSDNQQFIPIQLKECQFPREMKNQYTYMDATVSVDWDRLKRSMEHYCSK